MSSRKDPWFAPKRFGYGAGLPIAWQGWATVVAYIVTMVLAGLIMEGDRPELRPVAIGIMVVATIVFVLVARARTRGGWRWRSGDSD